MNKDSSKLFYQIALTKINGIGDILARNLLEAVGDVEAVFKSSKKELSAIDGISSVLVNNILDPEVFIKTEKELHFIEKNKLDTFFFTDENYPTRLKECIDSPVLLYFKGNCDLNASKVISVVGTRKSTTYGIDFCKTFLKDLSVTYPDLLIVSGLAYGIDIQSHKSALELNLPTVGVLAHGLDRIYPQRHRRYAIDMLEKGGLLTEFSAGTEPDKFNFVRRNRIVAGMADAVIVVQSDIKGGSLITAELANSYNKDVFAVPGRTTDIESAGCNMLIEQNKAVLLHSAENFIRSMQWDAYKEVIKPVQRSLFLDLTDEQQKIYDLLSECGSVHINFLASQIGVPMSSLLSVLLTMEMKSIISALPGNLYKLA